MILVLDGAKIEKNITEKAIQIEKKENCSLSSAFSLVGDALEKKSKVYEIKGLKKSKKEIPIVTEL